MNAIEQLKMIKIQKKLLLKKKRELQTKFLVEKAKLTEEYARNLEALIEGQFDDADEDIPLIKLSLPVAFSMFKLKILFYILIYLFCPFNFIVPKVF